MSVLKWREWLTVWGWVWRCCSPGGTSTFTMGFIDILKKIDILDILKNPNIQHTELLQTCISTSPRSSCRGASMEPETPSSSLASAVILPLSYLLLVRLAMSSEPAQDAERPDCSQLDLTDCLGRIGSSRESFTISFPLENVINSLPNC